MTKFYTFIKKTTLHFSKFSSILDLMLAPFLSAALFYSSHYIFTQYSSDSRVLLFLAFVSCFTAAIIIFTNFIEKLFEKVSPVIIRFILKRRR